MCNRMFRRTSKASPLRDKLQPIRLREVLDEWNLGGDGKHRIHRNDNYYNIIKNHFVNRHPNKCPNQHYNGGLLSLRSLQSVHGTPGEQWLRHDRHSRESDVPVHCL